MTILAISSGIAGLQRASASFETSASRIARSSVPGAEVDMAAEMINVIQAKFEFEASTKVVRMATDMQKSAIDILA